MRGLRVSRPDGQNGHSISALLHVLSSYIDAAARCFHHTTRPVRLPLNIELGPSIHHAGHITAIFRCRRRGFINDRQPALTFTFDGSTSGHCTVLPMMLLLLLMPWHLYFPTKFYDAVRSSQAKFSPRMDEQQVKFGGIQIFSRIDFFPPTFHPFYHYLIVKMLMGLGKMGLVSILRPSSDVSQWQNHVQFCRNIFKQTMAYA